MWGRLAGTGLCTLMILYWLGVALSGWGAPSDRFRVLLTVLLALIVAAAVRTALRRRADPAIAMGMIALGMFAGLGPVLLNEWIRGGGDRYVWVISQGYPCNTMGGGPGFVWVTGTSLLFALGALAFGWPESDARSRRRGIGFGFSLVALTALAMFPRPEVFATVLGCM